MGQINDCLSSEFWVLIWELQVRLSNMNIPSSLADTDDPSFCKCIWKLWVYSMWLNNHFICKWFVCASKFHSYHYTCKRLVWLVHRHDERIQKTSSRVHGLMEDADWRTVCMVETFIYGLIIFISYTLGDFIWVLPGIKYNLWPWLSEWGSEHTLSLKG